MDDGMELVRRLLKWPLGLAGPVLAALMGLAALHLPAGRARRAAPPSTPRSGIIFWPTPRF